MMKTVYRVEHIDYRHGPYVPSGMSKRHKDLSSRLCKAATASQPLPRVESLTTSEGDYFGFDSLISLIDWFELWLDELEAHDYHITVFNVAEEDVKVGTRQIVFPRKKYRRTSAIRMNEVKRCERKS